MIVFGAIFLVLVVTLIFYLLNPTEYKWWEFFIPLIITTGLIFGAKAIVDHTSVQFTEYWGETIIEIQEEEPWNEWVHKTCSYQVASGTDSDGNTTYTTVYYDCSYQDDHGPQWNSKTNLGNKYELTEHLYDSLVRVYKTGQQTIRTRSNYDGNDRAVGSNGTKFQGKKVGRYSRILSSKWPETDPTRKGVFTKHSYENRIKASDLSLFNISVVTKEQADSLGLYEYPERVNEYTFPTILGKNIPSETRENFRKLNAKFGPTNELRLWILVFDDKPAITATYQENYWVNGNKNELVVCIGRKGNEIQWAHSFSWSLSGTLTAETTSKVLEMYEYQVTSKDGRTLPVVLPIVNTSLKKTISDVTGIDTTMLPPVLPIGMVSSDVVKTIKSKTPVLTEDTWEAYYNYLNSNLKRFERRDFEEFSYLTVEPKTWQVIVIYILALLSSIGLNLWASMNEINDNKDKYRY